MWSYVNRPYALQVASQVAEPSTWKNKDRDRDRNSEDSRIVVMRVTRARDAHKLFHKNTSSIHNIYQAQSSYLMYSIENETIYSELYGRQVGRQKKIHCRTAHTGRLTSNLNEYSKFELLGVFALIFKDSLAKYLIRWEVKFLLCSTVKKIVFFFYFSHRWSKTIIFLSQYSWHFDRAEILHQIGRSVSSTQIHSYSHTLTIS